MIGYITIGVKDVKKAVGFYVNLLEDLGVKVIADRGRLVALGHSMQEPLLAVCIPSNGETATPGNGNMFAIPMASREQIDLTYNKALALGASCAGAPGERATGSYGAYVQDLDGNKMAFYWFSPELLEQPGH
jgi:predicted lactoylglutathione lyase